MNHLPEYIIPKKKNVGSVKNLEENSRRVQHLFHSNAHLFPGKIYETIVCTLDPNMMAKHAIIIGTKVSVVISACHCMSCSGFVPTT